MRLAANPALFHTFYYGEFSGKSQELCGIVMNNDLDRNQNNNLTNNESPTLPNAENVKD